MSNSMQIQQRCDVVKKLRSPGSLHVHTLRAQTPNIKWRPAKSIVPVFWSPESGLGSYSVLESTYGGLYPMISQTRLGKGQLAIRPSMNVPRKV